MIDATYLLHFKHNIYIYIYIYVVAEREREGIEREMERENICLICKCFSPTELQGATSPVEEPSCPGEEHLLH